MALSNPPPRDLPDRVIRESLHHPANLRAFLRRAVPQLAEGFDCERAHFLDREFPVDDWRRREADLPFEIPYRQGSEELWALVCLLIEHQSEADAVMPLRLLYFAVTYWNRQWRAWEQQPKPRPPLHLSPVLPIVLHTGSGAWTGNRTLLDLLGEPVEFHAFAPTWQPLFWNLSDQSTQELISSGDEWLQALAVLRAQGEETKAFEDVFRNVLQHLEGLYGREHVRWYDLMRIILTWSLWRRPRQERDNLLTAVQDNQENIMRQQEVQVMAQTIAEALIEEGEIKGMAKGEKQGRLLASRDILARLLTRQFGPLPESVLQRIEAATDFERLQACIDKVTEMQSLTELDL